MVRRSLLAGVLIAGVLGVPVSAHAAARGPALDPSFGGTGWVSNDQGVADEVIDLAV